MSGENTISVICTCGKKLKAPATAAGRKARCPACGATVVMTPSTGAIVPVAAIAKAPAPARKISPSTPTESKSKSSRPPPFVQEYDGFGALHELAEQADSAPTPAEKARCPQCRTGMDDGAVLCTNCGYDTRTGKSLSSATVAKQSTNTGKSAAAAIAGTRGKKPVDMMAPDGSFLMGLALSAAFALAASVLWVLVAYFVGLASGYIAFAIGGAAGAGMKIGQKGFSHAGGFAAAGMTLVAILLAKVAVVEMYLSAHHLNISIFDLDSAALGLYFLNPIALIIIAIGVFAAYRTANGSVTG